MKGIIAIFGAVVLGASMSAQAKIELSGSGATFPAPLYTVMFDTYAKATGTKVNYQAVGSGAGISALIAKTVDFGASDAPMTEAELAKAGAEVVHIPTCIGAIVMTYNVPGVTGQLKMTGSLIADIYLGKIDTWNDPAIVKLNPGVKLPAAQIIVVRRSDSSGTSYNFTTYLSKESDEWKTSVGVNKAPKWPVGVGGKGNPGVAAYIKQVPGSLGYVEIAYARQNKMPVAMIQNKAGNFVDPNNLKAVAMAGDLPSFPADSKADIIDTEAKDGYPIAAMTWLLVYRDQTFSGNKDKSLATLNLLSWIIHDGQKLNETVDYATLPAAAVKVAENLLKTVVFNGEQLLK